MHYGIIAAGEGSRLKQEGVEWPKPLVRLSGVPMIERLINIFIDCEAESISIIINEFMPEVRDFVERLSRRVPVPVRLVVKSTRSSMHSFFELSKVMGREGKFILTTVDTVFRPCEFAKYVKAFKEASSYTDALMAVTGYVDDEKPLYVYTDAAMKVSDFVDKPILGVKYVSGGIYGLTPRAFDVLDECVAEDVSRMRNFQRALLWNGFNVRAYLFDKIIDVDHADDIAKAEAFLESGSSKKLQTCQR